MTYLLNSNFRFTISLLLISLFMLSGCASLSKKECNSGDWVKIGANDGSRGLVATKQLSKHRKACSEYNVTPDKKRYDSGYAQGLKQFCQQKIGFRQGSKGSQYLGVCPAYLEKRFLQGYIPGLELAMDNLQNEMGNLQFQSFRIERKLDRLDYADNHGKKNKKRIDRLENRLDRVESSLSSNRSQQYKLRAWHAKWVSKL